LHPEAFRSFGICFRINQKILQSFEVLFPCFGTAYLKQTIQKTTELRYVLQNNSLKLRKNLRFQKYLICLLCQQSLSSNWPIQKTKNITRTNKIVYRNFGKKISVSSCSLSIFGNFSFFQIIIIPKFRKMIRTSWKFPKILWKFQLRIVSVSQTWSLYSLCKPINLSITFNRFGLRLR
jgi:hypothetical protein